MMFLVTVTVEAEEGVKKPLQFTPLTNELSVPRINMKNSHTTYKLYDTTLYDKQSLLSLRMKTKVVEHV